MYGSERAGDDAERTAFRKSEKKYKLYYENNPKSSKKKKQPKQVDLSEVLDFKFISELFNQKGELPPGVVHVNCGFERSVFGLENRPGFYFIPGAVTLDEQCKWIRESLANFPQPPNRTNHNVIYGTISNLFAAAKECKIFVEEERSNNDLDSDSSGSVSNGDCGRWTFHEEDIARSRGKTCKLVPASVLLRKLRWSTLGLQFNWSNQNYDVSLPHKKIPDALCQLAKRMAAPAMPVGEEFLPEAAIVNYFGSGDTLGGHLDDMEADWSKPIVSMSFGCKAIFLLGGKSREDEPLAMFLRSGDVVLMAGEARECFHGVPRIFTDEENAEITPLESQFSDEDDRCFLNYIRTSRININIRQVF
ncbi:hypothetical protein V6N12_049452 [Hibiscus sabdariffa]|uniref:Fe2OG dioxygenase domain-containing protein n=1 Tax=Hibiscus sabdariffa TaxID=183260 RepID=A0ABR2CC75_9ROSI